MIYGMLYEVVWLWRYNGTNMAPRVENFPTPTFFSHDPLRIHSSVRKCNKKFLALGLDSAAEGGGEVKAAVVYVCSTTLHDM